MYKRPGYREAIIWIAVNDNCYWVLDDVPMLSVTAALVVDLFGQKEDKVIRDIARKWREIYPRKWYNETS